MSDQSIISDEASTVAMVKQFDASQETCARVGAGVTGLQGGMSGGWQGNASTRFSGSLDNWLAGFAKVRQGLDRLNASMADYGKQTTSTEDDAALQGGAWSVNH